MDRTKIALAIRDSLVGQSRGKFDIDEDNQFILYNSDSNMMIDCLEVADAVKFVATLNE